MRNNEKYLKELKDIKSLSSKIKKINESIMFEDDFENFRGEEEQFPQDDELQQPMPRGDQKQQGLEQQQDLKQKSPEDAGMEQLDQMGEVDQIRKITLDGMRKLCNTPEDPQFQALLKIFQICNKSVDKEEIEQKQ